MSLAAQRPLKLHNNFNRCLSLKAPATCPCRVPAIALLPGNLGLCGSLPFGFELISTETAPASRWRVNATGVPLQPQNWAFANASTPAATLPFQQCKQQHVTLGPGLQLTVEDSCAVSLRLLERALSCLSVTLLQCHLVQQQVY